MTSEATGPPWPLIDLEHPSSLEECSCVSKEQHELLAQAIAAKRLALQQLEVQKQLREQAIAALANPDRRPYQQGLQHGLISAYGTARQLSFENAVYELNAEQCRECGGETQFQGGDLVCNSCGYTATG